MKRPIFWLGNHGTKLNQGFGTMKKKPTNVAWEPRERDPSSDFGTRKKKPILRLENLGKLRPPVAGFAWLSGVASWRWRCPFLRINLKESIVHGHHGPTQF